MHCSEWRHNLEDRSIGGYFNGIAADSGRAGSHGNLSSNLSWRCYPFDDNYVHIPTERRTDGRTDRQTDRQVCATAAIRRARYIDCTIITLTPITI